MLRVYRSESEAFVLIHESTQTVMLAESLDEAYDKLEAKLGDKLREAPPSASDRVGGKTQAWTRFGLVAVLALLPFIWLAVLHTSVGSLIVELRGTPPPAVPVEDAAAEPGAASTEFDALGARVERLANDVRSLKAQAKPEPKVTIANGDVEGHAGAGSGDESGGDEGAGTGGE